MANGYIDLDGAVATGRAPSAAEAVLVKDALEPYVGSPSSRYRSFVSCDVPATFNGVGVDKSNKGGDINIRTGLTPTTAWATAGYFSVAAAGNAIGYIGRDEMSCDLDTKSFLLAFTLNTPANSNSGTVPIMGNADASASQGFYLSLGGTAGNNNQMRVVFNTSTGVQTGTFTTKVVADGADHNIVVAINGPTKTYYIFVDGELDVTGTYTGIATPTLNFSIGNQGISLASGTVTPYAASKFAGFHALRFDRFLPANLGGVARRHHRSPKTVIRDSDMRSVRKSVILGVVGQSNEQGAGGYPSSTGDYGAPRRDSTARSMWPYLQSLAGERSTWLETFNGALGTTSLAHSWCGIVRAWVSGMVVTRGTYLLTSGNIYKCTGAASTVFTSTVAPTGTSPTQTGADSIQWTYMGAARAQDVAGYQYPPSDAYFDPNGYLAAVYAGTNKSAYDERWVAISIGQGDKTMSTARAEYAQALIHATNYFLNNSIKVLIGFTCYGATAGLEAWYQSDLLPGLADAIANFAGNTSVRTGPNLRTALGVLATSPASGPGLQADNLHMDNIAYALASKEYDRVLALEGISA